MARHDEHVRLVACRRDHPADAGRHGTVDRRERRAVARRGLCGMAGASRIAEMPELMSATVRLAERAGEQVPGFALEDIQDEVRLALGRRDQTIEEIVVRRAR